MTLVAYKIVKEPPGPWEVQIEKPVEWSGRFRSQDGVAWWSTALDRPLGEHHNNPGEDRMLRRLQAIVRGHELTQLHAVADAARDFLEAVDRSGERIPNLGALREALETLRASHPERMHCTTLAVDEALAVKVRNHPAYVGDGHPDLRRAGYQPEPEELPE
jgi:hypothetical protein